MMKSGKGNRSEKKVCVGLVLDSRYLEKKIEIKSDCFLREGSKILILNVFISMNLS